MQSKLNQRSKTFSLRNWEKAQLLIMGCALRRHEKREGWKGELPIYLAKCPEHGYFEDYPHGFITLLQCPHPKCEYKVFVARGQYL